MKFSANAIERAAAFHISAAFGLAVREALAEPDGDALLNHGDAGLAAAAAMLQEAAPGTDLGSLQLALAVIGAPGASGPLALEPDDAFAQPMLKDWAAPNFAQAVAAVIWAGATGALAALGSPYIAAVIVERAASGAVAGRIDMSFPGNEGRSSVAFLYGAPEGVSALKTTCTVTGDALITLAKGAALMTGEARITTLGQGASQGPARGETIH